jgi:hypothetical protein
MELLQALQDWYTAQCVDEWEHRHGIQIESCDNPGWWVKIDLKGTNLASREFQPIAECVDANGCQQGDRWLRCCVDGEVWNGAGDETKLPQIIQTFLTWAADAPGQTAGFVLI